MYHPMGWKQNVGGDWSGSCYRAWDLSFNKDLKGTLPPNLGNLQQLTYLSLAGCSFSGQIPKEIGNLSLLYFLELSTNQFSGTIPASLGSLSRLYWFDVSDNQLTGSIPVSPKNASGFDLLVNTKHFHFNKNKLSGDIPENLFCSQMTLLHILFDSNMFTGEIPSSAGLVKTLEILRLDNNLLSGPVPSTINNLTSVHELNLVNNQLNGSMPDLTGMSGLNYVNLSNNTFAETDIPDWFSTLRSLTTLIIENGRLRGQIPQELFSIPGLKQVYV